MDNPVPKKRGRPRKIYSKPIEDNNVCKKDEDIVLFLPLSDEKNEDTVNITDNISSDKNNDIYSSKKKMTN